MRPRNLNSSVFGVRCSATRGSVLIYVVWMVLLLALFAAGVGSQALFALDLSQRLSDQLNASYLARSAVTFAALRLERDPSPTFDGWNDVWADAPTVLDRHELAGGWFSVMGERLPNQGPKHGLVDEERRINLNTAPGEVLLRLAEFAGGLREHEALALADAIQDWRDEDDEQRPQGAENFFYHTLSQAYDCKDGPFENIEELLLVRGVSREVYERLEPFVTVYGSGRINLNTASEMVLRTLGLSHEGVLGVQRFRAGDDNQEGTGDDRELTAVGGLDAELGAYVPAEDLAQLKQLVQHNALSARSDAFRMAIDAEHGGPANHVQVFCVIDRQGAVKLWVER